MKWFVTGVGLGAIAAILYAPKAGAKTRKMLREKIDDAHRSVKGKQEESWSITDVINEGRDS